MLVEGYPDALLELQVPSETSPLCVAAAQLAEALAKEAEEKTKAEAAEEQVKQLQSDLVRKDYELKEQVKDPYLTLILTLTSTLTRAWTLTRTMTMAVTLTLIMNWTLDISSDPVLPLSTLTSHTVLPKS